MYEDTLARVRLFQTLAQRELTWLSEGCRERDFAAGTMLAQAGQSHTCLLVLLSGTLALAPDPDAGLDAGLDAGPDQPARHLGPGTVIGELALCDPAACQRTITTLEPCVALVLPHRDFQATLRESPEIAIKLLAVIGERLRQAQGRELERAGDVYDPSEAHTAP